ncbi:MAG: peptide chain release factor 2 [Acidimicrobiales bacterium]|nr:peptide chain release factor 2 [Acidimicrobiales bacterium]
MRDFTEDLDGLRKRLAEAATYLHVDELRQRRAQLEVEAARPDLWDDPEYARKVTAELAAVQDDLETYDELATVIDDAETLFELGREEGDDSVEAEIQTAIAKAGQRFDELELRSLFTGAYDDHDALCEIHAGEGGTDSQDWAEMMLRMYRRWAERHGYEMELDDLTPGQEAGISSATFIIKGRHAYGRLKGEKGTHRLVRISPFNAQGKRQTAFAGFTVVPFLEDEEPDLDIDEKDLRIDTYRSSGAGGQHVNVTDSAVRITHLPTGIVVSCQNERSQHQNKDRAMQILKAKLADLERQKREAEIASLAGPKQTMGFGTRIRSYVLHPYQQVKDERSGFEVGDVDGVLDGNLDPLIEAYLRWQRSEQGRDEAG